MKVAVILLSALIATPAAAFELCGSGPRVNCVVDGDTVWIAGEKIRLEDIDAPESGGGCEAERRIATQAASKLAELIGDGPVDIRRNGQDKYGRTLAVLAVNGQSVGETLISLGLAKRWEGHKAQWCN